MRGSLPFDDRGRGSGWWVWGLGNTCFLCTYDEAITKAMPWTGLDNGGDQVGGREYSMSEAFEQAVVIVSSASGGKGISYL